MRALEQLKRRGRFVPLTGLFGTSLHWPLGRIVVVGNIDPARYGCKVISPSEDSIPFSHLHYELVPIFPAPL